MRKISWRHVYAGLLSAFFVLGGTLNIFASPAVLADYSRWGFPDWFHIVTGLLEWTSALLMLSPALRLVGCALAGAVMTSAALTVVLHGEYPHAIPPVIVLVLLCLNAWMTWRARRSKGFSPAG
ncbi:DoxX family protein [Pseudodonghicola xiamenensis]|uniref:DoxX-like family protein n=1 Tax=Pseudodonghicola xiamenensis TaxID=337702 RepID=A0A8J3MEF4_9RHOB|nr:DoxX family protein [Pseudodonghicola xiamenensis]GHH03420.1 hypothetical protein GCM10010961_41460 [Pseudodonghicola xiamenensis]